MKRRDEYVCILIGVRERERERGGSSHKDLTLLIDMANKMLPYSTPSCSFPNSTLTLPTSHYEDQFVCGGGEGM